jgi:hypothetical protein
MYGAFNIAYGVGAACELLLYHCIVRHVVLFLLSSSGTSYRRSSEYLVHLIDRIYDHAEHSWMVLYLFSTGLIVVALALTFSYTGNDPLFRQRSRGLQTVPRLSATEMFASGSDNVFVALDLNEPENPPSPVMSKFRRNIRAKELPRNLEVDEVN